MKSYTFTRSIPVEDQYDILVAGGGPAGSAAAICAARMGAKVLLVEATGCLGGMSTSGLVNTFGPMGDGERTLVGGFTLELIEEMHARGFLGPEVTPHYWVTHYNRWIPFNPESLKRLLDDYCINAGVEIRYFTRVVDADTTGHSVSGAIISNIEGLRYIRAKAFIDATGDAVLAAACGVPCKIAGRDWPCQPATVCSTFSGINWDHPAYTTNRGTDAVRDAVKHEYLPKANADGHFSHPDHFIAGMKKIGNATGNLNGGHIYGLDGLSVKSLTEGMISGRRLAVEYTEFYRKYVPGCERIELAATSPVMGVRDTRRIVGEFELTYEDYRAARQFPDQIAVYNRPADVHSTNASKEEYERFMKDMHGSGKLARGKCVGIPYGILVPKGSENLWVAGRCHSSDTKVHGSIRAQSAAFMMGQAAATAAAQAIATGAPACDLDTQTLVETLRKHGSYLPQERLSRTMTRSEERG
jgi:hypothetical protein